jgi:nucleoside-diphosphate-sugar epimerase
MLCMSRRRALVAGATGLVGKAVAEYFLSTGEADVVAVSRRDPQLPGALHVPLDLTDAGACAELLGGLDGITHIVFAALFEKPDLVAGWRDPEQMSVNLTMLVNLLDAVEQNAPTLEHVSILQGTKAYGVHVEPIRVPAKEHWPRHDHKNFYWLQEDLIRERQAMGSGWSFSIWRPQALFGNALGSPMNIIGALGVFAVIRREQGLPLAFPGGGELVTAATDTRLLAEAIAWGSTAESAQNQTFNMINGDVLVWPHIFHSIANVFSMQMAEATPELLTDTMPAMEEVWAEMVGKYDLRRHTLAEWIGSSWQFTDRSLATGVEYPKPSVLSPVALNQAGFTKMIDTEDSIVWWLRRLQRERWLPA